jgi:predicted TIM-barrel fold metal-dependent hydrolase
MAALSKGRKDSFNIVLDHIFRVDYDHLNREKEELCDIIKARNIFLKIIMEIIYSTRTESVMMTLLGCQDTHSLHFFKLICQRTGEITQQ